MLASIYRSTSVVNNSLSHLLPTGTLTSRRRSFPTKMASKHLAAGSECPPKDADKIRLYGMKFCPFCERVQMVLILKNIPHDIVYINLKNKPSWLFDLHPEGKVPALDVGDRVITESLDIVQYLDDCYPEPPLQSADLQQRDRDSQVLQLFGKVLGPFFAAIYDKENKSLDEYMNEMYDLMDPIEQDLTLRGTLYFGGEKPGLLDYMMWPWTERSKVPSILFNEAFNFPKDRFHNLVEWRTAMKVAPGVQECIIEPERHAKLVQLNRQADKEGTHVDYDSV